MLEMIARKIVTDPKVQQVLDVLHREYNARHSKAKVDAYRYNKYSIRVRVLDPDLANIHLVDRSAMLWEILRKNLPKHVREQIDFFILLTPKEAKRSAMSKEFDDPTSDDED
jgi:hypothetical protein